MPYQSSSNYQNSANQLPTCDSWGNIKVGNANASQPTTVMDHSGVVSAQYLSTGKHGVSLSNPGRYGGGGYVVLYTPEVKDYSLPCMLTSVISGSTAPSLTAGFQFTTWRFPGPVGASGNTAENLDFTYNDLYVNFAAFAFKRSSDLYQPYAANLIKHSEQLDNTSSWSTSVGSAGGVAPVVIADADRNPINGQMNADLVVFDIGGATTNGSVWSILSQSISYNNDFRGVTGQNYTWSFWARSVGGGKTLSIRGAAGGPYTNITLTSEWKRYTGTEKIASAATEPTATQMGGINFTLRGNFPSGLNAGSVTALIWGVQIEPGSFATDYVKTDSVIPVYGNQDARKVLLPGGNGFGVSGGTHGSSLVSLSSKRAATAYGTIVIVPNASSTSSTVAAYVENAYNVSGVSAGANSTFDITFKAPMNNANYCVILSGENENSSSEVDNPLVDEYSMLLVDRTLKTTSGFRAFSLKQLATDNSWTRQSVRYQRGLLEKIHFMVFGGGTYGQA